MEEQKRRWFNSDKPLWLPEGSVRALLVIGCLLGVIIPLFKFMAFTEDIPQGVKEVLLVILGFLGGILKDYFTSRPANGTGA